MLTGYEYIAPQDRRAPRLAALTCRWMASFADRGIDKRMRREIAEMAKLGDHLLRDMGVTREDVRWAASQPLDVDAGQLLNRLARRDP